MIRQSSDHHARDPHGRHDRHLAKRGRREARLPRRDRDRRGRPVRHGRHFLRDHALLHRNRPSTSIRWRAFRYCPQRNERLGCNRLGAGSSDTEPRPRASNRSHPPQSPQASPSSECLCHTVPFQIHFLARHPEKRGRRGARLPNHDRDRRDRHDPHGRRVRHLEKRGHREARLTRHDLDRRGHHDPHGRHDRHPEKRGRRGARLPNHGRPVGQQIERKNRQRKIVNRSALDRQLKETSEHREIRRQEALNGG